MSIKLMSAIFETEFRDLPTGETSEDGKDKMVRSSSAKITMLALADHANDDGECWPGYTRLELKTGLSRQGVADAIKAIRYNGLAFISEEPSKKRTNLYTINLQCFPKLGDKEDNRLLVKPVDQSSQLTSDSQAGLPTLVKPVDLNHHTTVIEPSLLSQIEKQANKTVDAILQVALSPKAIQDAVTKFFKLTPKWEGNKFNREWMQWAMENNVTPELIERAANKWREDKAFNWRHPDLKAIQEKWLMLVDSDKPSNLQSEVTDDAHGSPMSW